jgi:DNA mismatch repair protein MutS
MAGLPDVVISRARQILSNLESHTLEVQANGNESSIITIEAAKAAQQKKAALHGLEHTPNQDKVPQLSLFQMNVDPRHEMIFNKLNAADTDRMTPIEALMLLSELRRLLQ